MSDFAEQRVRIKILSPQSEHIQDRACLHKKDRWSAQAAEFATSDMSKQMKVSFEVFFSLSQME